MGEVSEVHGSGGYLMYSVSELSKVYYLNVTQAHVDALAALVAPVLASVPVAYPFSTSELLRRLGCALGEGKGLSSMLAEVRRQHPTWTSVDPKRTFMKKPCYLWHSPRPLTPQEKVTAVKAALPAAGADEPWKVRDTNGETPRERTERLAALVPDTLEDGIDDLMSDPLDKGPNAQ